MNPTPRTPVWFILTRHWVTLLGAGLVTTAAISLLFVVPVHVRGGADNPYVGIIIFLILPACFLLGLMLIPIGIYLSKRQIRDVSEEPDFNRKAALRRVGLFVAVTTVLNLVIGTQITYRAVKQMETAQFCGARCHSMTPEFVAFQNSPHSRIECVECHVSPGLQGWVQSKTNGVRQLVHTVMGTEAKPVPPALTTNRLVPSNGTCEHCHWPQMFGGARLRVLSKFAEDEANTRSETVLLMMLGGGAISGIHGAHLAPGVHIRFAPSDASRTSIPLIEYRNDTKGESRVFVSGEAPAGVSTIEMQCVDCHNRPTHAFELPERALDQALATGRIASGLPFVKKIGLESLKTAYPSSTEAAAKLPAAVLTFYREKYPAIYASREQDVNDAAKEVLAIYNRNVFPDLNVTWGTYPSNLGHTDSPGCFRCHDGSHASQDGRVIAQDCNLCHEALVSDETSPQILTTLGLADRLSHIQKH